MEKVVVVVVIKLLPFDTYCGGSMDISFCFNGYYHVSIRDVPHSIFLLLLLALIWIRILNSDTVGQEGHTAAIPTTTVDRSG